MKLLKLKEPESQKNKKTIKYTMRMSLLFLLVMQSSCADKKASETSKLDNRPNVIIVITDDQGYGDLGHTGNSIIKTPHIDKFSTESVNLTNYHVGTTCAPTRAGLLTGRNCNRNGVWHTIMGASILNEGETTLADVFKANGYSTGMFGKWHLGDNHPFLPYDRGFQETFYHGGGGVGQTPDYWNNDYFDDTYFRNGVPEKKTGYCTDIWFDEAIKFIEDKKDNPFLCYLSLNAPHSPYNVPQEYYNLYKDEEQLSENQKRFYGMITNIDDNFSKLINRMESLGIVENTIMIFTTDNGTASRGYNAGMRGTKGSEYDGGHRVPFIIRWPKGNLIGGEKLNELTAHVDVLPTLTSLTGQSFKATKTMDGKDVSSYLLNKEEIGNRYLVTDTQRVPWPIKGKQSCVMNGDWRLIHGTELYNISEDPGQKTNVAEQYPKRVMEMNTFYQNWWSQVIKETKHSIINLGTTDAVDVITCHDAHTTDQYPPWNQTQIRKGKTMKPAPFLVNFVKSGTYRFHLRRWPVESKLALGAEVKDSIPSTSFANARINGKAMKFVKAHLEVANQKKTIKVDNNSESAILEVEVPQGKTKLFAYFDMENGEQSNAFYINVEKVNH
ncbi:arylsulfatase [Flavivirga spongiicola]|uniref:Arylsulfatase n=1 Tax=Flavivirga spongiicola TaxID=421621 RepID=A0ABU7XQ75_9FLAO|nr:arylsulfatase [Flavivirga sp. MEBiC05379]MDO5977918.1 arylsulfatase [Flavivirga sp. MEBiC05379]